MRILVVGNCQTGQIADLLSHLPQYRIKRFAFAELTDKENSPAFQRQFDAVITQGVNTALAPQFFDALKSHPRVILFPSLVFTGFQPDFSQRILVDGQRDLQSRLLVMAHGLGLGRDEARALFCHDIFDRLGHFAGFNQARTLFLRNLSRYLPDPGALFDAWFAGGPFFYQFNHPHLRVTEDVLRAILTPLGIAMPDRGIAGLIPDTLQQMQSFPTINHPRSDNPLLGGAARVKIGKTVLTLEGYVARIFDFLDRADARSGARPLALRTIPAEEMDAFRKIVEDWRQDRGRVMAVNPYADRPRRQFWADLVARPAPADVTPTARTRPMIGPATRVATAGSCFAQHIARTLQAEGLNYHVTEPGPEHLDAADRSAKGYGVFSARYGNIYTARQLLQLFRRAFGRFSSRHSAWAARRGTGWLDPFRPNIGETFASPAAVAEDRARHLAAVREMFTTTDVFVFTLGLTEAWVDRDDGTVFGVAPGVVARDVDAATIGFQNFGPAETRADMVSFLTEFRTVNPAARVILTVSPVPLIATWSDTDVLNATTWSKSVLRAVAGELERDFAQVTYFPSYEIITGNFTRGVYFEDDLRSVRPEGVAHVMRVFKESLVGEPDPAGPADEDAQPDAAALRHYTAQQDVICDEELIVR